MPSITLFATILDSEMPPAGRHYECIFTSRTLAAARTKTQWNGNKRLLVVDHWRRQKKESLNVVHVPTGQSYPAAIYELSPRS